MKEGKIGRERSPHVSGWLGQCGGSGLMMCQGAYSSIVENVRESTFAKWHHFDYKGNANTYSQWEDRYASRGL